MRVLKGETIAPGVALGRVHIEGWETDDGFPQRIASDQVEDQLNGLRESLQRSREQIDDLKSKHGENLGENELRIFDVHIAYLQDPMFVDEIEKLVMHERFSVRAAILRIANDYDRIFQLVEDDFLRERAGDFRDVATRVMRNLPVPDGQPGDRERPAGRYILAARKLTVNDLFQLDNEQVEGIVTEQGGISSHAGILARSMGIPTITGIQDLPGKLSRASFVILDAGAGELHVDPDERLRAEFEKAAENLRRAPVVAPSAERPHRTRDGTEVRMLAACGNLSEVNLARTFGMKGVGLYRTELMFLVERRLPTEDVLTHHYREVVRQRDDQIAAFRLLDVSSSVQVDGLPGGRERNPALGMRGVRALLHDGRVLRLQLRAILRAAAGAENAAILVPFVTSINDLQRVRAAILEERLALEKAGVAVAERISVAPIIEVPAAAFICHAFLNEADFLVVAIDDLRAILLGADRDTPMVREYYSMTHPAMIELLSRMAREAIRHDKQLILFGEGAANPQLLPFYLGVGIRSFAIAPVNLEPLLDALSRFTIDECQKIADKLLEAPRALDVQRILIRNQ